jgi:putative effector of murein hydrolase LrgA (UPF0299 family)
VQKCLSAILLDFDINGNVNGLAILWFILFSQILKLKGIFHLQNLILRMEIKVVRFARNNLDYLSY